SKKRELSSPEFDFDTKKNRILSGSISESEAANMSDISDLSVTEPMVSNTVTAEATGVPTTSDVSTHLTLQQADIQNIASLMKDSFAPHVNQIIVDSFEQQVTNLVSSIVEGVLAGLKVKVASLENENQELKARVVKLEEAVDNAEQYSRRNCLRITGIQEAENEVTDDVVISLARSIDVELSLQDIDRSHRLGRPEPGDIGTRKPRDIIVKFATYRMRAKFYKARVLTKSRGHRGVFVNEHLTKTRGRLMYQARQRVRSQQLKSAWSSDGVILVRHLNDFVQRINSENDLPEFVPLEPRRGVSQSGTAGTR
ncbi:MAG: hypothetical protein AB2693_23705, partial [Candidatus Thiodiazotropha sp.]